MRNNHRKIKRHESYERFDDKTKARKCALAAKGEDKRKKQRLTLRAKSESLSQVTPLGVNSRHETKRFFLLI